MLEGGGKNEAAPAGGVRICAALKKKENKENKKLNPLLSRDL